MVRSKLIVAVLLGSFLAIGAAVAATKARKIPKGNWGGDQINVTVEDNSATIEYSCARGKINGPLIVDSKGKFKLRGTHIVERGGPMRSDETVNARPAIYSGTLNGKKLSLTVTLTDTNEVVGKFTLDFGKQAELFRCV